jgi:type 2 lantibiotic biosynthesis protein LanM
LNNTSIEIDNTFNLTLSCLITPYLDDLATQLTAVVELDSGEQSAILDGARLALYDALHARLCRMLVLELHAARAKGTLNGVDGRQRWECFREIAAKAEFWQDLTKPYPTLTQRVAALLRNRCAAVGEFARRWAADRRSLEPLTGSPPGRLLKARFGAGDSHRGGQTVVLVESERGPIVYKPRSVAVDSALARLINDLSGFHPDALTMRVPRVLDRGNYGWAEFIEHRHASGHDELIQFYRGLGQWLAVMRLVSGTDLHAENLIAHGPYPVVIDCETLFTPKMPASPSGFGRAFDRAVQLVSGSVLSVGLLPGRAAGLGWRGIDLSAIGALPDQQPMMKQVGILDAGTDKARIGPILVEAPVARNHPSPRPELSKYWPELLSAFVDMTSMLRKLDSAGGLRGRLECFADCPIRVVLRGTESYAELGRMLWHPVSLHDEASARQRAAQLLAKMAAKSRLAPDDPAVIEAEIEDLLDGDTPFFTTRPAVGVLEGPRGTLWRKPQNLIDAALDNWRSADFDLERNVVRAALVSAYANEGWVPEEVSLWPSKARRDDLERRRRQAISGVMRQLIATAIHEDDGSVAWVAPTLQMSTGWSVQPIAHDLYGGTAGIAVLVAAQLREAAAGRADPVDGLKELLPSVLRTLDMAEAKYETLRRGDIKVRPLPPGSYFGVSSFIWTRLLLTGWGIGWDHGLARTVALADSIVESARTDSVHDVLYGKAGAIPPLLALADRTGDRRCLDIAIDLGNSLCAAACVQDGSAHWPQDFWPNGIGGYAHGVTGVGWSLAMLARTTGTARFDDMARAAFAFEDALFDDIEQNWLDLRMRPGGKTAGAWCHGSVGIGLAHLDLDPGLNQPGTEILFRRAVAATARLGLGWNHTPCHGDGGAWEILDAGFNLGIGSGELSREGLLAGWLTSIEDNGPLCGVTREVFSPGLMAGVGGIAYQLLRAHPDSNLPSILMLR